MYFWKYILAKKAGLSQKKCNMALYGLPVLPIAEAFEKTVTGNPISVTDALAQDALSLQVSFTPTQDGTPSIDSEPTTEPYLSKVVPRGNKEYYSLVGATVAWNQLVQITDFVSVTYGGITGTNNGDGTYTVNGRARDLFDVYRNYELTANHVYFAMGCPQGGNPYTYRLAFASKTDIGSGLIYKSEYGGNETLAISISNGTEVNNLVFRPQLFDLTLMFGSTIADYIASLEQATAGSGIAWLKSYGFFSKIYYAPNAGELISVNTSGHKIGSTTYPIDNIDLRGLFKLDANNKLYCEGDIYPPSGSVERKYGIVDLGTLNWQYNEAYMCWRTNDSASLVKTYTAQSDMVNNIAEKYVVDPIGSLNGQNFTDGKYILGTSGNLFLKNGSNTTTPSGLFLYELATPTTESATPYTSPIDVEAGGTEEFMDNRAVPIPVGNETYYASEYAVHGKTGVTVSHGATEDDPNPTEYEVEFTSQGTVYGGTVDIVSGVLSVTWAILSNPQNLHWITNSSQGMKNFQTESGTVSKKSGSDNWKCSRYSNGFIGTDKAEGIFIFDSGEVCIRDYRYWEHGGTSEETAAFKASLADVTIAYELATPLTYQLTPEQVTMLLGDNYLVTEDGTITITYMAGK